ncbi:hypothetical protein QFC21_004080 [Naganishia friedmannii]|uniref:Uncharacterized protein n=1 Tax=Naganishia friedmannii TaxID=89922 RepID=A0ACC2VJE0_9TREE|nr:hypothetical protein QFC21_004080 [Naganishia friedmannii]
MKYQHGAARLFAATIMLSYASYVGASSTNTTSPASHSFAKRELSESTYNRLAIIHASGGSSGLMSSVGSAATMLIFPIGILGARGLRILTAKWWWAHAAIQGIFGLGCIIAAFVLGVILNGPEGNFRAGHRRTGLVLLILVVVQSIFGIAIKLAAKTKIQDPDRVRSIKKHPLQNLFHILMGLAIVGLGFWQTWSGFGLIKQTSGGDLITPLVVYVLWGVIVGVVTSLYLAGLGTPLSPSSAKVAHELTFTFTVLGLIPLQLRKERERREDVHFYDDDEKYPRTRTIDHSRSGLGGVTSPGPLRNRYMTRDTPLATSNDINLADPVPVIGIAPSARVSASTLEEEILERQRVTSTAPLIGRRE